MLYRCAHFIQDKLPIIWSLIEWLNSSFFRIKYCRRLGRISHILNQYKGVIAANEENVEELVLFFSSQPEESFKYFRPHGYDSKTLRNLVRNPSFLMYIVKNDSDCVVGYFFLRCFFIGKAFLGKMVDASHQGRGIGKKMCLCAMDIATVLGLRMFETISRDNYASLISSQEVLDVKVIKKMENNYLYIEDIKKKKFVSCS